MSLVEEYWAAFKPRLTDIDRQREAELEFRSVLPHLSRGQNPRIPIYYRVVKNRRRRHEIRDDLKASILKEVTRMTGVSERDIREHCMLQNLVDARWLVFWGFTRLMKVSAAATGRFLGFNHTSVIYGTKNIIDRHADQCAELARRVLP